MKAVMISIQPKWCKLIASGKKTVEVRKTKPQIETPFKCYIYQTKTGKVGTGLFTADGEIMGRSVKNGMVIGEFVCKKIESFTTDYRMDRKQTERISGLSCVSMIDLAEYECNAPCLFGWHISDLVIYDKPKALREFVRYSEDDIRPCAKEYGFCQHEYFDYQENCNACDIDFDGDDCPYIRMQRPPQSWCYVEDLR